MMIIKGRFYSTLKCKENWYFAKDSSPQDHGMLKLYKLLYYGVNAPNSSAT